MVTPKLIYEKLKLIIQFVINNHINPLKKNTLKQIDNL